MNSSWVNTLDLCSPTGSPDAETMPSDGERLLGGLAEKNSAPRAKGETLVQRGLERGAGGIGKSAEDFPGTEGGGRSRICSYISRRYSKFVGKKISKYPCLTNRDEQGTIMFLRRVCTTGALCPGMVSGSVEKSERIRRCKGK